MEVNDIIKICYPGFSIISGSGLGADIGSGAFGTVYKIRNILGKCLAVKVIQYPKGQTKAIQNAKQEAERLYKYRDNPGVVGCENVVVFPDDYPLYGTFNMNDDVYTYILIAMECMSGTLKETIETAIAKHGGMDCGETMDIVDKILSTLIELERQGDYHRDIKPSNIMYDSEGRYKLGDFGIATNLEDTQSTAKYTRDYAAPEILFGGIIFNHTVDIYALGIVMLEMLGGTKPNDGQKFGLKGYEIDFADLFPAGTDGEIIRIFKKACAPMKDDRYQSAAEFKADIQSWMHNHPDEMSMYKKTGDELYGEGMHYYQKESMDRDVKRAEKFFLAAERKGHMAAVYQLGLLHDQDEEEEIRLKALKRIERAGKRKYAPALNYLAVKDFKDPACEDYTNCIQYLNQAIEEGSVTAIYNKALLLLGGIGLERDPEMAFYFMQEAADKDYAPAKEFIREMQGCKGEDRR